MHASKIRILVIDHNPLLREGLSLLINLQPDMEMVASATRAKEALELFRTHRPDLIIMDLDLPSGAGVAAVGQIREIDAKASIIGLMTYEGDSSGEAVLRAGDCGYLAKDRLHDELVPLIRECLNKGS